MEEMIEQIKDMVEELQEELQDVKREIMIAQVQLTDLRQHFERDLDQKEEKRIKPKEDPSLTYHLGHLREMISRHDLEIERLKRHVGLSD